MIHRRCTLYYTCMHVLLTGNKIVFYSQTTGIRGGYFKAWDNDKT